MKEVQGVAIGNITVVNTITCFNYMYYMMKFYIWRKFSQFLLKWIIYVILFFIVMKFLHFVRKTDKNSSLEFENVELKSSGNDEPDWTGIESSPFGNKERYGVNDMILPSSSSAINIVKKAHSKALDGNEVLSSDITFRTQDTQAKTGSYILANVKSDGNISFMSRGKNQTKLGTSNILFYSLNNGEMENSEKKNFVLIKTMKCATETLARILRRNCLLKDLNAMMPRDEHFYFSWPYLMDDSDYRLSDRPFQGLIDHAVYNKTIMNSYFPPRTTHYITIIRDPLKQFVSTFNYFKIEKISGIHSRRPVSEYLQNIEYYENIYTSPNTKGRLCIPNGFSVTKNLIAHCLGMPVGFPKNRTDISMNLPAVVKYIQEVDSEFSLVMIVDYFHESLILLKRLMKWTMKDIIYKHVNFGSYNFMLSDMDKIRHKQWSPIDYMMYDYFNQTFWKKIDSEGPNFFDEVRQFNLIQDKFNWYCWGYGERIRPRLDIPQSPFNSKFYINRNDCMMMDSSLLRELKQKFDDDNRHVKDTRPPLTKTTC